MTSSRYAAIILAAGFSSRMESFKPLLRLGEETIADRVMSLFTQAGVDVLLVTGWNKEALLAGIKNHPVTVVENPDYEMGMFTSVLSGIRELHGRHESFFVMPVDIPLVRPATIHRLMDEASMHPGKIIFPVFGNRRGHPPLIPANLIPAITEWKHEGGLKAVLRSREELAREVPVPDGNILFDIDSDDDIKASDERLRRYGIPTEAECAIIADVLCNVQPAVQRHCLKVAEVAMTIGRRVQQRGRGIDLDMVRAAAILHDVAKGTPEHAKTAGRMLSELGFGKVGAIVASHTDLRDADVPISLEMKIVYLADKYMEGERLVSIEERFRTWGRRFAVTAEAETAILERKAHALQVKRELESILDCSLDDMVFV